VGILDKLMAAEVNVGPKAFLKRKTGKVIVELDDRYLRPAEVDMLLGNASKAKQLLGWEPKVKFKQLVKLMAEFDLKNIEKHHGEEFLIDYDVQNEQE